MASRKGAGIFVLADEGSPVCNIITGNTGWPAGQISEFEIYAA